MTKEEAQAIARDSKSPFQAGDYAEAARLLGDLHSYDSSIEQGPNGEVMLGAEELSA